MECQVVEGDWWRMWALTCWGHRRHGTESINGVTVSKKKRTDVIAMCARGIILQEPTTRVVSPPFFNTFICIWEINWVALSLAVSVGHIKSSSMTQPFASLKFLLIYQTHERAHTQRLSDYSPVNTYNTPKCPQERRGGGGNGMGEGEWQRYHIPVHTTAMMCGAGQRKEGGWDKGGKEMWSMWLWQRREKSKDAGGSEEWQQGGKDVHAALKFKLNLTCSCIKRRSNMHGLDIFIRDEQNVRPNAWCGLVVLNVWAQSVLWYSLKKSLQTEEKCKKQPEKSHKMLISLSCQQFLKR